MRLVLDTNVVIDWLVFDDPYMAPLRERAEAKDIVVPTHGLAIAELTRVLAYPELKLTEERQARVLEQYCRQTTLAQMPDGFAVDAWRLPENFPRCRDPDDDLFLALAYHTAASALVTRDKVLLKMRKKVRRHGVTILDVQQMIALLSAAPATA
jgi:putative PIN family toxin of toxin-antitoxin system